MGKDALLAHFIFSNNLNHDLKHRYQWHNHLNFIFLLIFSHLLINLFIFFTLCSNCFLLHLLFRQCLLSTYLYFIKKIQIIKFANQFNFFI